MVAAFTGRGRQSHVGVGGRDYRELKEELGLDHFDERSWQGWQHHVALVTVAFAFLREEQRRRGTPKKTFADLAGDAPALFRSCLFAGAADVLGAEPALAAQSQPDAVLLEHRAGSSLSTLRLRADQQYLVSPG